jgi:hypothetical protein
MQLRQRKGSFMVGTFFTSLAKIFAFIGGVVTGLWGLWCTVIAFFGGHFPIPFVDWSTSGNVFLGLLFLFIVTPLLTGLVSQLFNWALIAIGLLIGAIGLLIGVATRRQPS